MPAGDSGFGLSVMLPCAKILGPVVAGKEREAAEPDRYEDWLREDCAVEAPEPTGLGLVLGGGHRPPVVG